MENGSLFPGIGLRSYGLFNKSFMGILTNMTREVKMVSKGELSYNFCFCKFVVVPLLSRSSLSVRLTSELMFFRLKIPLLTNCIKKEKKYGYFSGPLLFQVIRLHSKTSKRTEKNIFDKTEHSERKLRHSNIEEKEQIAH